jgi:hypothetical protein
MKGILAENGAPLSAGASHFFCAMEASLMPKECSKTANVDIHLRLRPELHDPLKKIAEHKYFSLNHLINSILAKYLRDSPHLLPLVVASVWFFIHN